MEHPTEFFSTCISQLKICEILIDDLLKDPLLDALTEEQNMRLKAYILLCHSAIEEYVEALGLSVLMLSVKRFKSDGGIGRPVVALLASGILSPSEYADLADNNKAEAGKKKRLNNLVSDIEGAVNRSVGRYRDYVTTKNHGIKSDDLDNIFNPVGMVIDPVLAGQLDSLGKKRGGIAHEFKAKVLFTASSAHSDINAIIVELKSLDEQACGVLLPAIEPWFRKGSELPAPAV